MFDLKNSTRSAPGSGLHEPFLSRAAEADVQETGSNGLGAFLAMRLIDQFAVEAPRLAASAVAYQISATLEFLRDLHPPNQEVTNLREIVRVAQVAHETDSRRMLFAPLLAFAFWLEEELRLEEALDVLDTAARISDGREEEDEVRLLLQRARVLRLVGRFENAREDYTEAGRVAVQLADSHSVLLSRIGCAVVSWKLGNLPKAERTLREVIDDSRHLSDKDAEARGLHDLAGVLYASGRTKEAIPPAFRAFQLYERPLHRSRALSDTGLLLKELGLYAAATRAFSVVLTGDLSREVRVRNLIQLLDLSALVSDRFSFERWRREIAAHSASLPVEDQVDYELKLGTGLYRFGHRVQGERRIQEAIALAERHRLGQRLFKAEELLSNIRGHHADESTSATPSQNSVEREPQLQETLDSLFALEASC